MSENKLHKRLKAFLLEIIIREKEASAWEHFKTLDLDCADLNEVILSTSFKHEAWELLKKKNAVMDDFLHIVNNVDEDNITREAEEILLDRFSLDNKSLQDIVEANKSNRAAELLFHQSPDNQQLIAIMKYSDLKDRAAAELLKRSPNLDELRKIIEYSGFKEEAWQQFIQQNPNNEEIMNIVHYTDLQDMAWDYLLARQPKKDELNEFVHGFAENGRKRNEAALYILSRRPKVSELTDLIQNDLQTEEAWAKLEKKKLKEEDLAYIIWRLLRQGSNYKNEAAALCLKFNPTAGNLWDIIEYTDLKDQAAERLVQTAKLTLYELEDLVVASAIPSVVKALSKRIKFDRSQVDEKKLIRKIAQKIVANPEILDVNSWHNGEKHSVGGWAITLNEAGKKVEKEYSSEIAACLLIPNYRHLIFADRETVLDGLNDIISAS